MCLYVGITLRNIDIFLIEIAFPLSLLKINVRNVKNK